MFSDPTDPLVTARLARHGAAWASTVLAVLRTPWPWAGAHLSLDAQDCDVTPTRLHPAFHGSLDWHSAVHMTASALALLDHGTSPTAPDDTTPPDDTLAELRAELDARLQPEHVAAEVAYLAERRSYERPYGWAWAATLAATARRVGERPDDLGERARGWAEALEPLADVVATHLVAWLPALAAPVRHGVHSNTALALGLARDAFDALDRSDAVEAIDAAALRWFGGDVDYPSDWEPSGSDFCSPALAEADLMRRVLSDEEFGPWLRTFLPVLGEPGDALLRLPEVLDPTDGQAAHLYGLGLSRSAMLRRLAPWLDDPARAVVLESSAEQFAWASPHITSGDFMSTHWLVSFALL